MANWLPSDENEANDTHIMATEVDAPRERSHDLLTVAQIDCRNGPTLHSLADTDFYTFTVEAPDLPATEYHTGVCVTINADFPITAKLTQDGTVLKSETDQQFRLRYGPVQLGCHLLQVSGPSLNAHTLRVRVCNPGGMVVSDRRVDRVGPGPPRKAEAAPPMAPLILSC